MLRLRTHLILSHTLPILITLPIMGFILIYVLETQVLLVNLTQKLVQHATILATIAADDPTIWQESRRAQPFLNRFAPVFTAHFTLLTPTGHLLASNNPADQPLLGTRLEIPDLTTLQAGQASVQSNYSPNLQAEVIDILMPVLDQRGQLMGIVRLTHVYATVVERFWRMRFLILAVLGVGLLIGLGAALFLALTVVRPVVRVTTAIQRFVHSDGNDILVETGTSEIRTLIRAFNELIERLHGQETTRKRLLANLIHEIRRPLGALSSATHALRYGASEQEPLRTELLDGMATEFQHIQQLMTDLHLVYEQAFGQITLDRQPTDLHEWLTTSLVHWRTAAQQKGLDWCAAIPDPLPILPIDPMRLGQALGNLVSNAIKFTPTPGTVTIAAGTTPTTFWITVTDSSPGIDPAEQEKIFEPFYRSHAHQRFPQGMGLGLTIARDLVVAHGGQLTVASTPSTGSHFTLTVPRAIPTPSLRV